MIQCDTQRRRLPPLTYKVLQWKLSSLFDILFLRHPASRLRSATRTIILFLLALELVLLDSEGHLQELLLLQAVNVLHTGGDGSTGVTAGVHDVLAVVVLGLVEQSLDAGLGEAPGTGIQRLLLTPDDGLCVGVHVEVLLQLLPGEGVKLLDTRKGDVVDLVVSTVLVQSGPNLASAKNDALNLLRRLDSAGLVLRIGDDPLEAGILGSELLKARAGKRMAEERLGEEDDESC